MSGLSLSRARLVSIVGAALLIVLVLGGVGVMALDHPLAELGVGGTSGTAFATVDQPNGAYTERLDHRFDRGETVLETTDVAVRYANGTIVRTTIYRSPGRRPDNLTRRESVRIDGDGFGYERYEAGSVPEDAGGEQEVVDGRAVYERRQASSVNDFGLADRSILRELTYARDGTTRRNGTQLVRYEVVGERGSVPLLSGDELGGYVLVTPDTGTIRAARITVAGPNGSPVIEYSGRPGATVPLPDWLSKARGIPSG